MPTRLEDVECAQDVTVPPPACTLLVWTTKQVVDLDALSWLGVAAPLPIAGGAYGAGGGAHSGGTNGAAPKLLPVLQRLLYSSMISLSAKS